LLAVQVNQKRPPPFHGQRSGQIDRRRCLPGSALVINDGQDHFSILSCFDVFMKDGFPLFLRKTRF
jgi:hypothetical protein